ncbi:hypothetical protein B566_EDAN009062 [Ephemera danica]|nr:hypothetical protein B566_EDAN009062 [Ephemera danica]
MSEVTQMDEGDPKLLQEVTKPTFGISSCSLRSLLENELLPPLWAGRDDELQRKLDELQENMLGPEQQKMLVDLLRREPPQSDLLYFLWQCLIGERCDPNVFYIIGKIRPDLLRLYLDFSKRRTWHNEQLITGFPLLCVARRLLPDDTTECLNRMRVLLELRADVNARHRDEPTPVHVAAERGAWDVVQFLLQHGADIDIRIGDVTTRDVIARMRPELVCDVPVKSSPPPSPLNLLYNALYAEDEAKFVELVSEHKINSNFHDGRDTLLQLAIKLRFVNAATALINNGADINLTAGNWTEPILLALENPDFECLTVFVQHRFQVNLRFWTIRGNFLYILAEEWKKNKNAKAHKHQFYCLIKEALRQRVNVCGPKDREDKSLAYGFHKDAKLFHPLLDHGGFLSINDKVIIQTPPEIFVRFFDDKITYLNDGREEYIKVNYGFLQSQDRSSYRVAEMLPFYEMCKSQLYTQTALLHPVVNLFLIYKWRRIAFIYIANFVLYTLFTAAFSFHIYQLTCQKIDSNTREAFFVLLFANFLWVFLLLREIFQMFLSFKKYIKNKENWLELLLLASSFLTFLPAFRDDNLVLAMSVILTYVELTLLISRHPSTGTYITMFLRISLKSILMLLMFASFIFAFAFSFFVFFYEGDQGMIRNLWDSVLHTSGMAVGELNINDLKFNSLPSELVFLAFLIFVTVVLMNLLNALAVSDTQSVMREATMLCCVANIKHYTRIESMFLGYDLENPSTVLGSNQNSDFLTKLSQFFCVNVLPFPNSKKCLFDLTQSGTLMIKIKRKGYYPHPYVNKFFDLYSIKLLLQYFYYRVLLGCNEDAILDEIVKSHKYRAPEKPSTKDDVKTLSEIQKELKMLQSVSNKILRDLLRRDLPQEELLYFFWRCLVEKRCTLDVIRIICETRRELLHLHLDLRDCELYPLFSGPPTCNPAEDQDQILGFPLTCLALNYLPDQHWECLERMRVLLELKADVNARHRDEPTPVHVAAQRGAWDVVQFLLQHGADIDIAIGDETTRDVIACMRPELVCDVPVKPSPPPSPLNLFYDALYDKDETRFSELLQENAGVDLNVHNGRETLLQLAIRQKLVKSTKELFKRGADINQMAGLCAQPILLALENPECECLKFLTKQKDKLQLRLTRDGGTFLHALGRVKYESPATLRDVFRALMDEALQQEVNVHARDNDDETALEVICLQKDPTIFHLILDHVGLYAVSSSVVQKTPPDVFVKYFDEKMVYREQGKDMEENINICFDFLKLREATTTEARAAEMLPFYEMLLDDIFLRLKFPKPSGNEQLETKCLTELRNTFQKMQAELKDHRKSQKLERIKSEELQQQMVNTCQSIQSDLMAEFRSAQSQMMKEINEMHEAHLAEIKLLQQAQLAQFKSLFPPELKAQTEETTP